VAQVVLEGSCGAVELDGVQRQDVLLARPVLSARESGAATLRHTGYIERGHKNARRLEGTTLLNYVNRPRLL
jgi:hypothetical protein